MVWPDRWKSVLVITLVFLLLYPGVVRAGVPSSYIRETVNAYYHTNGTLTSPVEWAGIVEVEVPDTQDVLQYLLLNLSGTGDTNLQNTMAYKDVAASPNSGDRTRLFLNTTTSRSSLSYGITNTGLAPVFYLELDYGNAAGGRDLHAGGTNYLSFSLLVNSTMNINGVIVRLMFARNTMGTADSMHITSASSTSGIAQAQDSDSDGIFDTLYWTGNLLAGVNVQVDFSGETTPGVNFDEAFMFVDLDQGTTSQATYQAGGTFTGITFVDRFSRGPIREGIEMVSVEYWIVRGFIRNLANSLDYRIHGWELYQVGQSSPVSSASNEIYPFVPGQTEYTAWYDTGSATSDKAGYYAASWDWEVGWGASSYSGLSQATITLPVLYEIDAWTDKSVVLNSNTESGTRLSMQDSVRHIGHSALGVGSVTINSYLPSQSQAGVSQSWIPSGFRVLHIDSGGSQTEITSQVTIVAVASGSLGDGYVIVSIPNMTAVIGRELLQNEEIRLEYTASGSAKATSQSYDFCQSSTLVTSSGTPVNSTTCLEETIPGIGGVPTPPEEPGRGPGAPPIAPPALFADIARELGQGYFLADNLVRVVAKYNIIDTGTVGVKDIKAVIYVPEHGSLDESSIVFRIYDSSAGVWGDWVQGTDYVLRDNGMVVFQDRNCREYVISKKPTGWIFEEGLNLFNGDKIEIEYLTKIPVGTSILVTRVAGYNYYENKHIFEDLYIPVRREGTLQDLEITEGEWQVEKVYVGRPVKWIKGLEVHNPNKVAVENSVSFEVFPDTLTAYMMREEGDGREFLELKQANVTYVDVVVRMGAGESKSYFLEAVTPPVLETQRGVDVLDSSEREITFMINVTLENFAQEDYPVASYLFEVPAGKVKSVYESGKELNYSEFDERTTEIYLGWFGSGWERRISIVYTEVPPILLTAINKIRYSCLDRAGITIFVIPSEREVNSYLEFEVVGPEPKLKTTNAQLIEMREMWPWEEVEIPMEIDLSNYPDGRYFVYTQFKRNFETVLSDRTDFYVSCPERMVISISWVGFLAVAIAVILYLVVRSRARKRQEGVEDLKRKIRKLK